MSGSRSQLRVVKNPVWIWRRDVWGSWLEGLLKTRAIPWTRSISGARSDEMKIFLEVGLFISGSISQLRVVTNRVWVQRRGMWGSWLEGSLKTWVIFCTGSVSGARSAETKIFWELTLDRERSETGTAWGCIWSLKFLSIVWFRSCTLLMYERILLRSERNVSCNLSSNLVIFLRQASASSVEEIL